MVRISESGSFRLFRVPVDGGQEKEIVTDGSLTLEPFGVLSPEFANRGWPAVASAATTRFVV